jgi:hypothetical protein
VDAAGEADVVGCVDVDAEVVKRVECGVVEREDSFDENEATGNDGLEGSGDAGVVGEVVDGAVDGVAGGERADVLYEELACEGVGVVEVLLVARIQRKLAEVAVIEIEREECGVKLRGKLAGERGLAGAGAAGDADEDRELRQAELFRFGVHE